MVVHYDIWWSRRYSLFLTGGGKGILFNLSESAAQLSYYVLVHVELCNRCNRSAVYIITVILNCRVHIPVCKLLNVTYLLNIRGLIHNLVIVMLCPSSHFLISTALLMNGTNVLYARHSELTNACVEKLFNTKEVSGCCMLKLLSLL